MYTLVVVESPNKVRKIEAILGPGYRCAATCGHFRDLPLSGDLGVAFVNDQVVANYVVMESGKRALASIAKLAREASEVILATDPDREGEAISWHLAQVLRLPKRVQCRRATFQELTPQAVRAAVAAPRSIDLPLVHAQQARRILDRCVGWIVSDTMRRSMADARSAGRVQSVAVRLVVEREREITAFVPHRYFAIDAILERTPRQTKFIARLHTYEGKPVGQDWTDAGQADAAAARCRRATYQVAKVDRVEVAKPAPAPFITSTVQMAASVALRLAPKATMAGLQRLFEAGHITYHRTDAPVLSQEAVAGARAWISAHLPTSFLPSKPRSHAAKAGAQEAHEAIRPTHWQSGPQGVTGEDAELYTLIWKRFIASQCADGRDSHTTVMIHACDKNSTAPFAVFRAKGVMPVFDGWRRITLLSEPEPEEPVLGKDEFYAQELLPSMERNDWLCLLEVIAQRLATKAPPRFTEARLIAELEKRGIGRPSTYASIMEAIVLRQYVRIDQRKLHATPLGTSSIDFLTQHFTGNFIDVTYTSEVETALDRIARGELAWQPFTIACATKLMTCAQGAGYVGNPFLAQPAMPRLEAMTSAAHAVGATTARRADSPSCPLCQKAMTSRQGAHGAFWGCSGYPKCRGTRSSTASAS